MKRTIKAVSYARFSPRPNAAECESVEAQEAQIVAYCLAKGYELVGRYSDKALSGASDDRPGLEDAIGSLRRGQVLIVAAMDRLARGNALTEALLLQIAARGASVETCDGVITRSESKDARLLRTIKQAIAEYQRDTTRELTSQRMRHYQENGRRMSSNVLYGWRDAGTLEVVDSKGQRRIQRMTEVCPEEQETIEEISRLRASGLTLKSIGRELESQGRLNRGKRWNHVQILRILGRLKPEPPLCV